MGRRDLYQRGSDTTPTRCLPPAETLASAGNENPSNAS